MKQTAVEWLVGQLTFKTSGGVYTTDGIDDVTNLVEQAKEMEKKQIVDAVDSWIHTGNMKGEQYYNEIYNTNEKWNRRQ